MYISHIRIDGFTSYRHDMAVDGLSPNVNVILGRNGSGKSNIFTAVRFVLDDLPGRNNLGLVHNGRGRRSTTTKVEVTLADTGNLFPNYEDPITFSRSLDTEGDHYTVNNTSVSKSTAHLLLDSAGLSLKDNAFFIIPQGDVTSLASATDEERLNTMLIASGAQTFEERRQKAVRNLDTYNQRLEETTELMDRMNEYLQRVAQEAENLKEHLQIRKRKRGVEYVLLSVEQMRTRLVIANEDTKLEEQRQRLEATVRKLAEHAADLSSRREATANADDRLAEISAELEMAERQAALTREQLRSVTNMATAQMSGFGDGGEESLPMTLHPASNSGEELLSHGDEDDGYMDRTIEEKDVKEVTDRLAYVRAELSEKMKLMATINARVRAYQLRQGRAQQMGAEEIAAQREKALRKSDQALSEIKDSLQAERARLGKISEMLSAAQEKLSQAEEASTEAARAKAEASAENKEAQQMLSDSESSRNRALLALRRADITYERLEKTSERVSKQLLAYNRAPMVRGIRQVRDMVAQLGLGSSKYYGTVADIIQVQPVVDYAIDRIAGSRLYYHVVDNSETVEAIMSGLRKSAPRMTGMATFIPLADIIVPDTSIIPETARDSGSPLKEMVSVRDPRFEKVIQLIFGEYYLCRDADVALEFSRTYDVSTVTVEGDLCDPRGAISGGSSHEVAMSSAGGSSRLKLIRELGDVYNQMAQHKDTAREQRKVADQASQRVTQSLELANQLRLYLQRATQAAQDASIPVAEAQAEIALLSRKQSSAESSIKVNEQKLETAEQERLAATSDSDFASPLTADEEADLQSLTSQEWELEQSCNELSNTEYTLSHQSREITRAYERQKVAAEKARLVIDRTHQSEEYAIAAESAQERNRLARADVIRLRREQEKAEGEANHYHEQLGVAEDSVRDIENELKILNRKVENHSVKMQALDKLVKDIDEKMNHMASIPEDALQKAQEYMNPSSPEHVQSDQDLKRVVRELTTEETALDHELKALGTVNMRAINDHESYSKQLETLSSEYDSLEVDRRLILDTIADLESQKQKKLDNMLSRFVSKFEQLYYALTDGERGTLVINRDPVSNMLTSIGLDVSYGTSPDQFSGGQKCLCALALIFAIQSCDPAPFYIFDEIDAHLDENARKRVAQLIRHISDSSGTQFICTTFREELVSVADAWFGVIFDRHHSQIEPIAKDIAFSFVAGNGHADEERASST